MSVIPFKPDIRQREWRVRYVPDQTRQPTAEMAFQLLLAMKQLTREACNTLVQGIRFENWRAGVGLLVLRAVWGSTIERRSRMESAMPPLSSFRVLVLVLFLASTFGAAAAESVGVVTNVQNQAEIGATTATAGTPVHMNDRLHTGANARLRITFRDNSVLTLGENANVVIDRYVFNPDKSTGQVALNATRGAFRFAGGKIEQMREKKVTVTTPVAAMAVRGTDFWAGHIDGQYGVLLLKGRVRVSNRAGAVTLSHPGWGTDIPLRGRGSRKKARG